jgi:hypothetical protein
LLGNEILRILKEFLKLKIDGTLTEKIHTFDENRPTLGNAFLSLSSRSEKI